MRPPHRIATVLTLLLAVGAACSAEPADTAPTAPFAVGSQTFALSYGERTLVVEAWYPSSASEAAVALPELATTTAVGARLQGLVDAAPKGCVTPSLQLARGGAAAAGRFPIILFSHCHGCTRWSSASLMRSIARQGFVVLAPDHAGNTLLEHEDGAGATLGKDFLEVRVADLSAVLDDTLSAQPKALPAALHGHVDVDRVGAIGHSFGSVTVGLLTQRDPRVRATAGVAAPMSNPLIPGVDMAKLDRPLLFFLAEEDNSITVLGNTLIENNHKDAAGPAWLVRLPDAGHWSMSDVPGLVDAFMPGCGAGKRMTGGEDFTYPAPASTRERVIPWLEAFFLAHVAGDDVARKTLDTLSGEPGASFAP